MKMNTKILLLVMLLKCCSLYSETFPQVQLVDQQFQPVDIQLSSNANELVYYYNMYWLVKPPEGKPIPEEIVRMLRSRAGWRPRELTEEHSTEEYREAWEELLPYWIDGSILNATAIYSRIQDYFRKSKSPQSIPVLCEMFTNTVNNTKQVSGIEKKQKFLFDTLITIGTKEAFYGVFDALDLLDKQSPEAEGLRDSGRSFVFNVMTFCQFNGGGGKYTDIILSRVLHNQHTLMQMDISSLSQKNQDLVIRILGFRHPMIDYSDDPIFGTNVVEQVLKTNIIEKSIEPHVVSNLVVETVEPSVKGETNLAEVDDSEITEVFREPNNKKLFVFFAILLASIAMVIIIKNRKSS
jgi:hypothetical protein